MPDKLDKLIDLLSKDSPHNDDAGHPAGPLNCNVPSDLVFDDEPLDGVIYGDQHAGPTPASIFRKCHERLDRLRAAANTGQMSELLEHTTEFLQGDFPIHRGDYELARSLLRQLPQILSQRPDGSSAADCVTLLEHLWLLAKQFGDDDLAALAGDRLSKSLEAAGRFADSREVVGQLCAIAKRLGNQRLEAIYINNYGFTYWLAGDYSNAAIHFDQAAVIQKQLGNEVEYANARINYCACGIEESGIECMEVFEPELRHHAALMERHKDWRERKARIYLAKMAILGGDEAAAIPLVERAVQLGQQLNPTYLERDQQFLQELKRREE